MPIGVLYDKKKTIDRKKLVTDDDFVPIVSLESGGKYPQKGHKIINQKEKAVKKLSEYLDVNKQNQTLEKVMLDGSKEIVLRFKVSKGNSNANDDTGKIVAKGIGVKVLTSTPIKIDYGEYIALKISSEGLQDNAYIDFYASDNDSYFYNVSNVFCGRVGIQISKIRKIWNAYPKKSKYKDHHAMYKLIGGYLERWHTEILTDKNLANDHSLVNTCALRMSRALNYSGYPIPEKKEKGYRTCKGGDSKNYFITVENIKRYLLETFKPSPKTVTRKTESEVIFIETECGWSDATGHVDLFVDGEYGSAHHDVCKNVVGWTSLD